ncbi:hypothetical protein [Flavobacterium anhuiense]|uniref:hypothetical protein n=1 Tax=Flavobacterium anhuiense TaxID=459526 RepID=UPI0034D95C13
MIANYNEIIEKLKDLNWKKFNIIFNINKGSIGYDKIEYVDDNDVDIFFWIRFGEIGDLINSIRNKFYSNVDDFSKRFNKYQIEIYPDGEVTEKEWWDSEKEKKDLLDSADVFYQWVNELMMSMIFEYEKDNNLIPTQYDSDGDLEYLSSWDSGVFTFHINKNNNLVYKVVLTKDGKERTLDLPLRDYFVEGILDHYKVTNNELSDDWKPWNTMILKSLHYDIPYDKREEFVNYILE